MSIQRTNLLPLKLGGGLALAGFCPATVDAAGGLRRLLGGGVSFHEDLTKRMSAAVTQKYKMNKKRLEGGNRTTKTKLDQHKLDGGIKVGTGMIQSAAITELASKLTNEHVKLLHENIMKFGMLFFFFALFFLTFML